MKNSLCIYILIIVLFYNKGYGQELTPIQKRFTGICDTINIETQKYLVNTYFDPKTKKKIYEGQLDSCNNIDDIDSKTSLKYLLKPETQGKNIKIYQNIEHQKKNLRDDLVDSNYIDMLYKFEDFCFNELINVREEENTKHDIREIIQTIIRKEINSFITIVLNSKIDDLSFKHSKEIIEKKDEINTTRSYNQYLLIGIGIIIIFIIIYFITGYTSIRKQKLIIYKFYKRLFFLANNYLSKKYTQEDYNDIHSLLIQFEIDQGIKKYFKASSIKIKNICGRISNKALDKAIEKIRLEINNKIKKSSTNENSNFDNHVSPEGMKTSQQNFKMTSNEIINELKNIANKAENYDLIKSHFSGKIETKIVELSHEVKNQTNLGKAKFELGNFLNELVIDFEKTRIDQQRLKKILKEKEIEYTEKYWRQFKKSLSENEITDIVSKETQSFKKRYNEPYIEEAQLISNLEEIERMIISVIESTIANQNTFYLTFPGPGFFIDSKKSKNFNDQSAFILKIDPQDEKIGEFEFVEKKERRNNAINNYKLLLNPVCEFSNPPLNAKDFVLLNKGKVHKEGDKWVVDEKMKISFTY